MSDTNQSKFAAYCQSCGKGLAQEEVRSVGGIIYCEACLEARLRGAQPGTAAPGWTPVGAPGQPNYARIPQPGAPSPVIAALLGFIPGVGAMYNGQFVKALLHVVVFIVLIGASEHFDLAGILVAAWIFYQIFDAAHTAAARRDGRPVPDPLGLLDLSQRLGPQTPVPPTTVPPANPYTSAPPPPPVNPAQAADAPNWGAWANKVAQSEAERRTGVPFGEQPIAPGAPYPGQPFAGSTQNPGPDPRYGNFAPGFTPVPPVPPAPPSGWFGRRNEPIGAIVLIAVGILFLLSTLGVLSRNWIGHSWPLLVLLLGLAALFRRLRTPAAQAPVQPYVAQPQPPVETSTEIARRQDSWSDAETNREEER